MSPYCGPLIRNPCKPALEHHSKPASRQGPICSEPFKEAKGRRKTIGLKFGAISAGLAQVSRKGSEYPGLPRPFTKELDGY